MPGIHDIKHRIKSIRDTRQITKAMNLISAAKLKKARNQLDMALPYFNKVKETIADILNHIGEVDNPFFNYQVKQKNSKKAFIVLTGDKGLAGGYHQNIIRLTEQKLADHPDTVLYIAGLMGKSHFVRKNYTVDMDFNYPVQNPTVFRAREIAETVFDIYQSGKVTEVYIIYTLMLSSLSMEPQFMKLLPLDPDTFKKDVPSSRQKPTNERLAVSMEDMLYEPSSKVVFDTLVIKYLKGIIYGAFVEAFTSEQSARMVAMENATANADEILSKLSLEYNRARQSAITQEISEVVAGAEIFK